MLEKILRQRKPTHWLRRPSEGARRSLPGIALGVDAPTLEFISKNEAARDTPNTILLTMLDERSGLPSNKSKCILISAFGIILFSLAFVWQISITDESSLTIFGFDTKFHVSDEHSSQARDTGNSDSLGELLDIGVYKDHDFVNEIGVTPPYWNNETRYSPKETITKQWGPCFGSHDHVEWEAEVKKSQGRIRPSFPTQAVGVEKNDWADYCRPGFLIIGAGKCGTSVCCHRKRLQKFVLVVLFLHLIIICCPLESHCTITSLITRGYCRLL